MNPFSSFFTGNGFFQRSKKTPALPPSVTDRKRHRGTGRGVERSYCKSSVSDVYSVSGCKRRGGGYVLGTAPRRLLHSPTQLNLRQFIESRKTKDITLWGVCQIVQDFSQEGVEMQDGHMNHCVCWPNRLIYIAVDRKVLWPNPIKDTAYEKKKHGTQAYQPDQANDWKSRCPT